MKYALTKGNLPGRYTLGEGFILEAKGNELPAALAAPYVDAGILEAEQAPKAARKKKARK